MPLEARSISLSGQRQLIVGCYDDNKFVVLPADGDGPLTTVRTDIPDGEGWWHFVQTQAGYVVYKKYYNTPVYFTDRGGRVVHEATDCERPLCPAVTSWGHVLIADYLGHDIKVFSEVGDYLGRLRDNSRQINYPEYIHIDEAEGLLYVVCGPPDVLGASELRKYRFTAGELPPVLTTRSVTKMTMTLTLPAV